MTRADLGAGIATARAAHGLDPDDLAGDARCDVEQVNAAERGEAVPVAILRRMVTALPGYSSGLLVALRAVTDAERPPSWVCQGTTPCGWRGSKPDRLNGAPICPDCDGMVTEVAP